MDALREVCAHAADPAFAMKCNAQSASMMRQARGAIGTLQRMHDGRRKLAANAESADRAAWTDAPAVVLPGPAPPPDPEPAEPPPPDPVAEAELYAAIYPDRAALIRRHGGMPPDARFGPPEPYVERELVHGRSPALLALDRRAEWVARCGTASRVACNETKVRETADGGTLSGASRLPLPLRGRGVSLRWR